MGHPVSKRVFPAGRVIEATVRFVLPVAADEDHIEEYVLSEMLDNGSISRENPLLRSRVESLDDPVLRDTGQRFRIENEEDYRAFKPGKYRRWLETDTRKV